MGKRFLLSFIMKEPFFTAPEKNPHETQTPMQKGPWHVVEVRVLGLTKFSVVSDQLCMVLNVFNADTWLRKSVNILTNDYKELDLLPAVYKRFCETRETVDIQAVELDNVMLMKWFVEYSILSRASSS